MLPFLAERNEQEEIKNNNGKLSINNSLTNFNLFFIAIIANITYNKREKK